MSINPFPNYDQGRGEPYPRPSEQPEQPCRVCGEGTSHGADVDSGRGFVRYPICNTDCLQDLIARMGGGAGSQVRARYPSAHDL